MFSSDMLDLGRYVILYKYEPEDPAWLGDEPITGYKFSDEEMWANLQEKWHVPDSLADS